jgi:hypothetical protein
LKVAIIDPSGLFGGDRLRRCSNAAQLHWPRLYLASDGFGRLEINYARIVGRAYSTFNPIPSEADLQSFIQEYVNTFLLFPYEVGAQLWGQWDTRAELLPRYKTAADRRSPIPPEPAFSKWKQMYRTQQKAFPKSFGKISATFLHGGGVGEGVGNIKTCSPGGERQPILPSLDNLPFDTLDELPAAPPPAVPSTKNSNWGPKEKIRVFRERFWPAWPRKVARADAERAWVKHATTPEIAEKIVKAAKDQTAMLTGDGLKFCPYPASWLNARRYLDDPGEAPLNGTGDPAAGGPQYTDWKPAWDRNTDA